MSNKSTHIPIHKGLLYDEMLRKYPSWMRLSVDRDDIGDFISVASSLQTHVVEKRIDDFYNSYASTVTVTDPGNYYSIDSLDDFSSEMFVSGSYLTGLSYAGSIGLTLVDTVDDFETYMPTRFTCDESSAITISVAGSGQALCYASSSALSGIYYASFSSDATLYSLNESYGVVGSGNFHTFHVEEALEFVPVSGEYYEATLSNTPSTSVRLFDIYNPGSLISGVYFLSGSYYSIGDQREYFGQLRAAYSYEDFTGIVRATTGRVIHDINQWTDFPAFVTGETNEILRPEPTKSRVASVRSFSIPCTELVHGEVVDVVFKYDVYNILDKTLSGTYEIPIPSTDTVYEDSVRILSTSATEDLVYYDSSTTFISNKQEPGWTAYGNIDSEDFEVFSDDTHLLIKNLTAVSGPFKVVYYTERSKTYSVAGRQSYTPIRNSSSPIPSYPKDYEIKDNVAIPVTIIPLTETGSTILYQLYSAPIEKFSFTVKRWRKGLTYDPFYKNYWVLESSDILYNMERPRDRYYIPRYLENESVSTNLYSSTDKGTGWLPNGSNYYKRIELENYIPNNAYTLFNMTLFGSSLAILAHRNEQYYIVLVNRFDPTQVTVYPIKDWTGI